MTHRSPSVALALAMRASSSSSDRRRYRSGSGWRSPMLCFSKSVRTLMSIFASIRRPVAAFRLKAEATGEGNPPPKGGTTGEIEHASCHAGRDLVWRVRTGDNVIQRVALDGLTAGAA